MNPSHDHRDFADEKETQIYEDSIDNQVAQLQLEDKARNTACKFFEKRVQLCDDNGTQTVFLTTTPPPSAQRRRQSLKIFRIEIPSFVMPSRVSSTRSFKPVIAQTAVVC